MKNSDGLTHKQFLFCEELLKNGFCVYKAYKVAYPNDRGTNNGPRMLKRIEVINYLNKRQQEKEHTMDKLLDIANKRLASIIATGSDKDAAKAIEILKNSQEKLKALEVAKDTPPSVQTNPIIIRLEDARNNP
jgi:phage terminase small subunit